LKSRYGDKIEVKKFNLLESKEYEDFVKSYFGYIVVPAYFVEENKNIVGFYSYVELNKYLCERFDVSPCEQIRI